MCAADDIDAIAIISSTGCHAEHIRKALEAGKHVFCEKPLAGSVEECLEVERIIAAHPERQKYPLKSFSAGIFFHTVASRENEIFPAHSRFASALNFPSQRFLA